MAGGTHTCPAPGCAREVSDELLACREHWYALPKPLRDALWRAYNDHGRGSPAHTAAVDACLRALERLGGAVPGARADGPYHLQPQRVVYLRRRLEMIAQAHTENGVRIGLGPADAADLLQLLSYLTARANA